MLIKILGTGCPNCIKLESNTKLALQKMGIEATIEKVTDIVDIMSYNIMSNPGLVVDGKVVSSGKVLDVDDIVLLIQGEKPKEDNIPKKGGCSCGGKC